MVPATSSLLLSVEKVSARYGRVEAVRDISFTISQGELITVLGPNGAGKSTLLGTIAGIVPLVGGRISLLNEDLKGTRSFRRVSKGLSLVPEGRGRFPGLTVMENLRLGWSAAAASRRGTWEQELEKVLRLFPVLEARAKQDCSTLSGGEMQMLAISRALLAKPIVLLLDEPSLGLAPLAVEKVYEALSRLNVSSMAMIIVEQKAIPLPAIKQKTLVLSNGTCVYEQERRPTVDELTELYFGKRSGL